MNQIVHNHRGQLLGVAIHFAQCLDLAQELPPVVNQMQRMDRLQGGVGIRLKLQVIRRVLS